MKRSGLNICIIGLRLLDLHRIDKLRWHCRLISIQSRDTQKSCWLLSLNLHSTIGDADDIVSEILKSLRPVSAKK